MKVCGGVHDRKVAGGSPVQVGVDSFVQPPHPTPVFKSCSHAKHVDLLVLWAYKNMFGGGANNGKPLVFRTLFSVAF